MLYFETFIFRFYHSVSITSNWICLNKCITFVILLPYLLLLGLWFIDTYEFMSCWLYYSTNKQIYLAKCELCNHAHISWMFIVVSLKFISYQISGGYSYYSSHSYTTNYVWNKLKWNNNKHSTDAWLQSYLIAIA